MSATSAVAFPRETQNLSRSREEHVPAPSARPSGARDHQLQAARSTLAAYRFMNNGPSGTAIEDKCATNVACQKNCVMPRPSPETDNAISAESVDTFRPQWPARIREWLIVIPGAPMLDCLVEGSIGRLGRLSRSVHLRNQRPDFQLWNKKTGRFARAVIS